MHGLTRNCRDFEPMIAALDHAEFDLKARYIVPDQRGRGLSDYSSPETYSPMTYSQDMWALMDFLEIENFLVIGTSMGGIISLLMHAENSSRIKGICLNDIGPSIDNEGLGKILEYLGKNIHAANWDEAVENTKTTQMMNFPDFSEQNWLDFAKQLYRQNDSGNLSLDYDIAIAEPIKSSLEAATPTDLWPLFNNTIHTPILIIRGALSNLLSKETVTKMKEAHPLAQSVEIANRGHAPLLNEPGAISGILSWIEQCNGME